MGNIAYKFSGSGKMVRERKQLLPSFNNLVGIL